MDTRQKNPGQRQRSSADVATKSAQRKAAQSRVRKNGDVQVVYTQPKPFNRSRFLLRLITVITVVLALTFGMSIFFKVDKDVITVSGAQKYKPEEIIAASGIQDGENLLTLSEAGISGKITTQLPYVNKVRVGIKLPDTVNIEVEELDVAYAVEGNDGTWWLMDAGGKLVDKINSAVAKKYTQILGVQLQEASLGQQAVAAEPEEETQPDSTDNTTEESQSMPTVVTVKGSDRLDAVLSILHNLEENSVIGQIASIDVTNLNSLQMYYGDQFLVNLGDSSQLNYKISCMKAAVNQMEDYESGELDVSFTIRPDEVVYTPLQ